MDVSGNWKIYNPSGKHRVLVTKELPGKDWLKILVNAEYKVEVYASNEVLNKQKLIERIGENCSAVIGQLTEKWDEELFDVLKAAKGIIYCNYAVGYDNVDIVAANRNQILVANTPGVLTETTAEMAVALTMACCRRIVEADAYTRADFFKGWVPDLFLGKRLWRGTLGIVGAGRIGSAYAMMMVRAFQMNLVYYSNKKNEFLEKEIKIYNKYLEEVSGLPLTVDYLPTLERVLRVADVVSLHIPLNKTSYHLISDTELLMMKKDAVLINTSRGPIINEAALATYCRENVKFYVGLDVFEKEPIVHDDLKKLSNVILAPHIASATNWTRENMAKLASLNVMGAIEDYPLWSQEDIQLFLNPDPPKAIPSIVKFNG